jgi:hypothetical protein
MIPAKKYYIEFCILNNIKNKHDWNQLYSMLESIMDFPYPRDPVDTYGEDVWEFIGSCIRRVQMPSYGHTVYIARAFKIRTKEQWKLFVKNVSDPCKFGFVIAPDINYRDDWMSWGDFLGYHQDLEHAQVINNTDKKQVVQQV